MLFKEKKMSKFITDDIEIFSDILIEKTLMKKIVMKKIRSRIFF